MRRGVRLKHIKATTDKRTGKVYLYFRKPGCTLVRLPNLPETHPEFRQAYAEAERGVEKHPSARQSREGTIAALVASLSGRLYERLRERWDNRISETIRDGHTIG